jgi:hypothetical protein
MTMTTKGSTPVSVASGSCSTTRTCVARISRVERRLREQGAEIDRVVLENDLRREYQEWLQEHNRGRSKSDGRPDRDEHEIEVWARQHDLRYFDDKVHSPISALSTSSMAATVTRM